MRSLWVFLLCIILPSLAFSQETVTLEWDPPTTNVDGSPLTDLERYDLYMDFVPIPDDKGTAVIVATIPEGTNMEMVDVVLPAIGSTVYFRVIVVDTSGNESVLSNQVSKDFLSSVTVILRFVQP